jgi:hypothetical protein
MIQLLFLLITSAMANLHLAPPQFKIGNRNAIWTDFTNAEYHIVYNHEEYKAYVTTEITFSNIHVGFPLFDLISEPEEVWLDGMLVTQNLINLPEGVSQVRIINKKIAPGIHKLTIKSPLERGLLWTPRGVSSAFWIRDLLDRDFLERYIPTNLEYDQYKMTFNIQIIGTDNSHHLNANGEVTEIQKNHFIVEYPEFYTTTSVFFHLTPNSRFWRWELTYKSIDGREIPLTIYSKFKFFNRLLRNKAMKVLAELERDYGPWPHPKIIIYGTRLKGGMEYVGATMTSLVSLGHELFHSYFAKGVMPANGNSGWMDEALASWRDNEYQRLSAPLFGPTNLANHSPFTRKTDKNSYKVGRSFMGYLDYKIHELGHDGLKVFLKEFFEKNIFKLVTTQDFLNELNSFTGSDFTADFNYYVMGIENQNVVVPYRPLNAREESEHHRAYTEQELQGLL